MGENVSNDVKETVHCVHLAYDSDDGIGENVNKPSNKLKRIS
jgi:hypothetical protein